MSWKVMTMNMIVTRKTSLENEEIDDEKDEDGCKENYEDDAELVEEKERHGESEEDVETMNIITSDHESLPLTSPSLTLGSYDFFSPFLMRFLMNFLSFLHSNNALTMQLQGWKNICTNCGRNSVSCMLLSMVDMGISGFFTWETVRRINPSPMAIKLNYPDHVPEIKDDKALKMCSIKDDNYLKIVRAVMVSLWKVSMLYCFLTSLQRLAAMVLVESSFCFAARPALTCRSQWQRKMLMMKACLKFSLRVESWITGTTPSIMTCFTLMKSTLSSNRKLCILTLRSSVKFTSVSMVAWHPGESKVETNLNASHYLWCNVKSVMARLLMSLLPKSLSCPIWCLSSGKKAAMSRASSSCLKLPVSLLSAPCILSPDFSMSAPNLSMLKLPMFRGSIFILNNMKPPDSLCCIMFELLVCKCLHPSSPSAADTVSYVSLTLTGCSQLDLTATQPASQAILMLFSSTSFRKQCKQCLFKLSKENFIEGLSSFHNICCSLNLGKLH